MAEWQEVIFSESNSSCWKKKPFGLGGGGGLRKEAHRAKHNREAECECLEMHSVED